jgi:hypothetical protein
MKQLFQNKIFIYTIGTVLGALSGYLYWKFVGCESGTCAITSKPFNSTLYFGLVGFIAAGLVIPSKAKQ